MQINLIVLRTLMLEAMNEEEFDTFCADYFAAVCVEFGSQMSLQQKVFLLIQHCKRREAIKTLVARVQEFNPAKYYVYEAQLSSPPKA